MRIEHHIVNDVAVVEVGGEILGSGSDLMLTDKTSLCAIVAGRPPSSDCSPADAGIVTRSNMLTTQRSTQRRVRLPSRSVAESETV